MNTFCHPEQESPSEVVEITLLLLLLLLVILTGGGESSKLLLKWQKENNEECFLLEALSGILILESLKKYGNQNKEIM